jgi:hypothetical protein
MLPALIAGDEIPVVPFSVIAIYNTTQLEPEGIVTVIPELTVIGPTDEAFLFVVSV